MRNALKIDLFRILSENGFAFTSKDIDAFAERLEAEQFIMDESGSFWSPSGESLVSAVYSRWSDSTPAAAPVKPAPNSPSQLPWSDADIANTKDPAVRLRKIADNENAAGMTHKSAAVKSAGLPNGMSADDFARLTPEQKIALGNEQTRVANGWSTGGVGF